MMWLHSVDLLQHTHTLVIEARTHKHNSCVTFSNLRSYEVLISGTRGRSITVSPLAKETTAS